MFQTTSQSGFDSTFWIREAAWNGMQWHGIFVSGLVRHSPPKIAKSRCAWFCSPGWNCWNCWANDMDSGWAEGSKWLGMQKQLQHLALMQPKTICIWKILEPLFNFSQYLSLWSHVSLALPPLPPLPLQIKLWSLEFCASFDAKCQTSNLFPIHLRWHPPHPSLYHLYLSGDFVADRFSTFSGVLWSSHHAAELVPWPRGRFNWLSKIWRFANCQFQRQRTANSQSLGIPVSPFFFIARARHSSQRIRGNLWGCCRQLTFSTTVIVVIYVDRKAREKKKRNCHERPCELVRSAVPLVWRKSVVQFSQLRAAAQV